MAKMKTIDFKGKAYVEVSERIKYFRSEEQYKNWSLESELLKFEDGICIVKATIKDDKEVIKATGLAYEKENSSFINKTSYLENCETSAWGRALANLSIGVDASIASYNEVGNAVLNQNKSTKNAENTQANAENKQVQPKSTTTGDRVECKGCKALISVGMAKATNGLCMACKNAK